MKNSKKRGFTIVELVIVIAVIAILAGVLIPTFVSIINKANVSSDTALVRGINEALAIEGVTEKPATMHDALRNASAYGYTIEKLTPRSSGDIVWNSETNHFALVDKDGNTVYSVNGETITKNPAVWKIAHSNAEISSEYSNYLAYAPSGTFTSSTGVDVGENTNVAVSYSSEATQTVTIRTNGGALTVNGSNSVVNHYGLAATVVVEKVHTNSYHEYGYVTDYLEAKVGHVAIESGASVSILAINGAATVDQNSGSELFKVVPVTGTTIDTAKVKVQPSVTIETKQISAEELANTKYGGGQGTQAAPYEFYIASHLVAFAKDVNAGVFTNYVYGKLCANINVGGMGWEPIGNAITPFYGLFDGQGHKISGLTNKGYAASVKLFGTTATSKNSGQAYGLFGVIGLKENPTSGTIETIAIKNVNLTDVDIESADFNMVGALVGADVAAAKIGDAYVNANYNGAVEIKNITVAGKIVSTNTSGATIGGVVGKIYTKGNMVVSGCTNNAAITSDVADSKCAGIVGFISAAKATIENSKNNANITAINTVSDKVTYVAGIVTFGGSGEVEYVLTLKECSNTGKLSCNDFVAHIAQQAGKHYKVVAVNCTAGVSLYYDQKIVDYQCNNNGSSGKIWADNVKNADGKYVVRIIDACRWGNTENTKEYVSGSSMTFDYATKTWTKN